MGDLSSCFRRGGCNEGNTEWILEEYETFERAFLVVFYYHQGEREGVGRCWAFKVNDSAIYVTNIYSKGVDLKYEGFKFTIVRLIRKLFNLSENVKFAVGKNAPLPIYLNGDGIVIYEPTVFNSSDEVLEEIKRLKSVCLWCGGYTIMKELTRTERELRYDNRYVSGLIVCNYCFGAIKDLEMCADCQEYFHYESMVHIGNFYVCQDCFDRYWIYCDECGEPERIENTITTLEGNILCESCALRLGARCCICGEFYFYDREREGIAIEQYRITYQFSTRVEYVCDKCAEKYLKIYQCEECGREVKYLSSEYMRSEILRDMVRLGLCIDCYYEKRRGAHDSAFCGIDYPSLFMQGVDPAERVLREVLETE